MDLLSKIETLYNQGLSMSEVASALGIKMGRVNSLMKWHKIPRRTASETHKIQYLKRSPSFTKKAVLSKTERELQVAGIMLYWAEGSKRGRCAVDFANSDERMISLFLAMLRRVYGVNEAKLRVFLYCYSNQNVAELINHWSTLLKIPTEQFTKPYIRSDYDDNNPRKMKYGLVHIRYFDSKLLMDILREIDIIGSGLIC